MKSESLTVRILLVFLGLQCVFGSKDDVQFKVRINEKGTRFSEKIRVNEKENTVRFMVPKHNDVDHSEVLNDFNLNLTITRLPDKGVCYIKPLDKSLTNPRKMKSDMSHVRRIQARIQKAGILVSSTEWTIDKQLEAKDLHPTVVKFCAGFSVYRLKEITKDSWKIEQQSGSGNDSSSTGKRELEKRLAEVPLCDSQLKNLPCPASKWKYYCSFIARKCVFWAKCGIIHVLRNPRNSCGFRHSYDSVICCEFRCG